MAGNIKINIVKKHKSKKQKMSVQKNRSLKKKSFNKSTKKYNMRGMGSVLYAFKGGAHQLEQDFQKLEKKQAKLLNLINDYNTKLGLNISSQEKEKLIKEIKTLMKKKIEYEQKKDKLTQKMKTLMGSLINITQKANEDLK